MVAKYGADSVRSYILFMGPAESDVEWSDQGIEGVSRFLGRVWRQATQAIEDGLLGSGAGGDEGFVDGGGGSSAGGTAAFDPAALRAEERTLLVKANQVIQKASADMGERFRLNTALAAIMELSNDVGAALATGRAGESEEAKDAPGGLVATARGRAVLAYALETMIRLVEPFAPHMGAELWEMMGREAIWDEPWPEPDPRFLVEDTVELAVQVNGKVRDHVEVARDTAPEDVLAAAKGLPGVVRYLEGKTLVKEMVVRGRLVSLVVK